MRGWNCPLWGQLYPKIATKKGDGKYLSPRRQDAEGEFGGSEIFLLFASAALADIISLITTIRFGAGAAVLEIVRQQGRKR